MFENVDEELLSAYLDDEVTPDQRAQVEQCLRDSPDWRRLFDELRALRASIMALPRYRLDEDLDRRVLADAERRLLNPGLQDPIQSNAIQADPLHADPDRPSAGAADGAGLTPPADALDAVDWPRLRFPRGWRAWAWPAVAVAAALLIRAYDNQPQPQKVAQAPPAESPAAEAASGKATATHAPAAKKSSEEWRPRHAPAFEGPRETSIGAAPSPASKEESIASDQRAPAPPDASGAADRMAPADRMAKGEPNAAMDKSKDSVALDKALYQANEKSEFPPADDGLLVVEAALRPEAAERGAFNDLLARNSIGPEVAAYGRATNQLSQSRMAQSRMAQSRMAQSPLAQSRMLQSNRNDASALQPGSVALVSEIYVEASPRQIAATLAEMQQRADEFAAVDVQPAAQSRRQQQFVQFNCNRIDGSLPLANSVTNESSTVDAQAKAASSTAAAAPARSRPGAAMRRKGANQARAANQPQAPAAAGAYRNQDQLNDDVARQAETRRQSNAQLKGQAEMKGQADGGGAGGEAATADKMPAKQGAAEQAAAEQAGGQQALSDKADGEKASDDETKMRVVFLLWTAQPVERGLGRPTAAPAPASPPPPPAVKPAVEK